MSMKTPSSREHFLNNELRRRGEVLNDVMREYNSMVGCHFADDKVKAMKRYTDTDVSEMLNSIFRAANDVSRMADLILNERAQI